MKSAIEQEPIGDAAFLGVKMRQHPRLVPPGYVAAAVNARFSTGKAEPRKGPWLTGWTNLAAAAYEGGGQVHAFGQVHGACVFQDPNSIDWFIIAADGKVYFTTEHMAARELPLPAGVVLTGEVSFYTCFSELVMLRGAALPSLRMPNMNLPWLTVAQVDNDPTLALLNPTDGTEAIPNGSVGLAMQNRFFVAFNKDYVGASDYFNYTRYQPVLDAFRVNAGDNETLVALHEYNANTMIALKSGSVHAVSGVQGDLSGLGRATVTDEYGASSRKAVITVGKDVWFWASQRGVASITQTEQNKIQGVDVPVSLDMQPVVKRVNFAAESGICAAKVGNFSYWAVPLDGATHNNAVLVYDHENQAWAGYDEGTIIRPKFWLVKKFRGVERLFMLTDTGYLAAYEELFTDQVSATEFEGVAFRVDTRAYALRNKVGRLRCRALTLQLGTWAPRYTVTALLDGVNESRTIADEVTRDRTKYEKPHTAARYVESNINDDHDTPYREDYSISLRQEAVESGAVVAGVTYYVSGGAINYLRPTEALVTDGDETPIVTDGDETPIVLDDYPVLANGTFVPLAGYAAWVAIDGAPVVYGPGSFLSLGSGINPDLHQEATAKYRCPKGTRGQAVQFRIENDQGRCELHGVSAEGTEVDRAAGVQV